MKASVNVRSRGVVDRVLGIVAKILAVITTVVGICVVLGFLVPSFNAATDEYIVTDKEVDGIGRNISFHLPDEVEKQSIVASQQLYDAARPGDCLQMDRMRQYRRLVRDGRVVARELSDEQYQNIIFVTAAFFPLLVFFRCSHRGVKLSILVGATVVELAVLGIVLYWLVLELAVGLGGGH